MMKLIKKDKHSKKAAIIEIDDEGNEQIVKAGMAEAEAEKELGEMDDEGVIYEKD